MENRVRGSEDVREGANMETVRKARTTYLDKDGREITFNEYKRLQSPEDIKKPITGGKKDESTGKKNPSSN